MTINSNVCLLLAGTLAILKLTGIITLGWFWILSPIILVLGLFLAIMGVFSLCVAVFGFNALKISRRK